MSENTAMQPEEPIELLPGQNMADLRQAFDTFNQMSEQLSHSYQLLESRVVELSGELASISEQRMEELAEKERIADQLESLLALMPAGVIVLDTQGRIQRANPAAQALLDDGSLLGRYWAQIVKHEFSPRASDGHEISLRNGKLVSLATAPLEESGQLVLMTDLTETRALQDKIARHDRLTAMGKMVASLAHQIRTPLSAAMLYAGNLQRQKLSDEQRLKFVNKLTGRLQHLEQQVRDMLVFAKGNSRLIDVLSVKEFVDQLQNAVEATQASQRVQLSVKHQGNNSLIQCNVDSLIGAIQNLINNGIEVVAPEIANIQVEVSLSDDDLVITVLDHGPGLDRDSAEKAFEPFFTTKSQGTGLGLAVVNAVAQAHKGRFTLKNIPTGCLAMLSLPIVILPAHSNLSGSPS